MTQRLSIDAADVRRLLDLEEIKQRKARYGELVDINVRAPAAAHKEAFLALFTDDAVADFGFDTGPMVGRAAIADALMGRIAAQRSWMWHSFHSPQIDIDGDRATARWTVEALAKSRGVDVVDRVIGRYMDEFVRTPQGWRQSRLTFVREQ